MQSPSPQGDVRPAGDNEEIYYSGTPMLRGEMGSLIFWNFLALISLAGAGYLLYRWNEFAPWWVGLILIGIGAIFILVPILVNKFESYRISNYRIDVEKGILSKRIDTLELWHVEDIRFNQSLFDRILGVGTITVISHDDTTPQLHLRSLPAPRKLFDTLKNRVIAVKRQRGVLKVDSPSMPLAE